MCCIWVELPVQRRLCPIFVRNVGSPDIHECFHELTGSQLTPGIWGVTHFLRGVYAILVFDLKRGDIREEAAKLPILGFFSLDLDFSRGKEKKNNKSYVFIWFRGEENYFLTFYKV